MIFIKENKLIASRGSNELTIFLHEIGMSNPANRHTMILPPALLKVAKQTGKTIAWSNKKRVNHGGNRRSKNYKTTQDLEEAAIIIRRKEHELAVALRPINEETVG